MTAAGYHAGKRAADRTGIPYTSLRDAAFRGELPVVRLGRAGHLAFTFNEIAEAVRVGREVTLQDRPRMIAWLNDTLDQVADEPGADMDSGDRTLDTRATSPTYDEVRAALAGEQQRSSQLQKRAEPIRRREPKKPMAARRHVPQRHRGKIGRAPSSAWLQRSRLRVRVGACTFRAAL